MHRIKGTDPIRDTKEKLKALGPVSGRVLDTATGLGYTAIEAAKTADHVLTLELDPGDSDLCSSRMTTHVNKVHHVTTITQVARDLEEDEDWLWDIANELEIEDGVIWVYGVGEARILAFTDFGIESLIELIKMHKNDPTLLKRWNRSE